jgi:hypothetical protein
MKKTKIQNVVAQYEERIKGKWKPDARFYSEVGINQKRFGMLLRGELPMYGFEATSLAHFFGVEVTEILNNEKSEKKTKSPTPQITV